MNAIIKSNVTSKTSLSELANVLDSRLARESMFIRYDNWSKIHTQPTNISVSTQLLPEVDKWLSEFLIPPVLSLQRSEIAEALWYNTILVSRENVNIINLMKQKSENDFYENLEDFPATNIEEIITNLSWEITRYRSAHKNYVIIFENGNHICTCLRLINHGLFCRYFAKIMTMSQIAAFHILMVSQRWYLDKQYSKSDMSLRSLLSIIYQNGRAISTFNFMPNLNLMHQNSNIPYNVSKVLKSRRAYGVTNGLCKKAINESYDLEESSKKNLEENQENIDPSAVRDPIIKKRKGASRVKCIKSSFEATNTQSNVIQEKAKRLCSHCKQPNHYAKTCTVSAAAIMIDFDHQVTDYGNKKVGEIVGEEIGEIVGEEIGEIVGEEIGEIVVEIVVVIDSEIVVEMIVRVIDGEIVGEFDAEMVVVADLYHAFLKKFFVHLKYL
ncbi:hypothetical protein C2G38_2215891 [Gigaspora rosea]|uniref:SWIM-type domain-containing protein n=1 Tax=Gigaspora rosea TaxID=44941 RepID=A0A397UHX0_9GLOM|nr:hypothetical protein C2G38_2215891 [Gigaspora rosea]